MSKHEHLGPIMMDLRGPEMDADERDMLLHPLVGGVILFTRNYVDPEQITELCRQIHALRDPKLLIAVDHEGGRVQRFRTGFTEVPAAGSLHQLYDDDPRAAHAHARDFGWLMAAEMRSVGVDLSFAPVLDLDLGISQVIGTRAFHSNPAAVADLASGYLAGMRAAGMEGTGKHFPGHGSVAVDSHLALPVDGREFAEVEKRDMDAFRRLQRQDLAAMMVAHIEYPAIDPIPSGFSHFWVTEVLRERMGFDGAVFTDDLSMGGASGFGTYDERARRALEAGCDMALICNTTEGVVQVLDGLEWEPDPVAHMRLVRMHGRPAPDRVELMDSALWKDTVERVRPFQDFDYSGPSVGE